MKMKNYNKIYKAAAIILAAAALFTSCAKEKFFSKKVSEEKEGIYEVTLQACSIETRTTITRDGNILPVVWKSGDKVYVFGETDGYIGSLDLDDDSIGEHDGTFTGKLSSSWVTSSQVLHVYYLGEGDVDIDQVNNEFTFDISTQYGSLDSIAKKGHITHGATGPLNPGNQTISVGDFANMNAVILFNLSNWTKGVNILGSNNKAVIDLKSGTIKSTTQGEIALSAKACTDSSYVTIIPGTYTFNFKKAEKLTPSNQNTLLAGYFYSNNGAPFIINPVSGGGYTEEGYGYGPGIEINGVVWAPVNCGIGYDYEYSSGLFYQWNRKYGQVLDSDPTFESTLQSSASEGNDVSYKNSFFINNECWYSGNAVTDKWDFDPCPEGWRVPTVSEFNSLNAKGHTWVTDKSYDGKSSGTYSGAMFGTGDNQIFLPGNGYRAYNGNRVSDNICNYWSNEPSQSYPNYGKYLMISNSDTQIGNQDRRAMGYSVRCVQNFTKNDGPILVSSLKTETTILTNATIVQSEFNKSVTLTGRTGSGCERVFFPIENLEVGQWYTITFSELMTKEGSQGWWVGDGVYATVVRETKIMDLQTSGNIIQKTGQNPTLFGYAICPNQVPYVPVEKGSTTFLATAETMYWTWEFSQQNDGVTYQWIFNLVDTGIKKITPDNEYYADMPNATMYGYTGGDGSTRGLNSYKRYADYHTIEFFSIGDGGHEKFNIPLTGLTVGKSYRLTFDYSRTNSDGGSNDLINESNLDICFGISATEVSNISSSNLHNTTGYTDNFTTRTLTEQTLEFEATATTMYWVWSQSKLKDGVRFFQVANNVKLEMLP